MQVTETVIFLIVFLRRRDPYRPNSKYITYLLSLYNIIYQDMYVPDLKQSYESFFNKPNLILMFACRWKGGNKVKLLLVIKRVCYFNGTLINNTVLNSS